MANNFENPEVFMKVAKAAAGHYADSYAVKLLAFSENATYLVYDPATDEKLFVLRVGRPGYHTREEYESEISWLRQINDYTPLSAGGNLDGCNKVLFSERFRYIAKHAHFRCFLDLVCLRVGGNHHNGT